jgi:glutamate racemase
MIGIFDSGAGGLTVLRALRARMPSADIVYFGDTKNAPYGQRPREELTKLTVDALQLLQNRGAERIISACNSVSASLAISLYDALRIKPNDLIEMVGPTVAYFRHADARILLVATEATIKSGMYQNAFRMLGKEVACVAIPDLAGAIEKCVESEAMKNIIRKTIKDELGSFDILILACTHYPLISKLFEEVIGDEVLIFDPALAVAERAEQQFWPQEVGNSTTKILISAESPSFQPLLTELFPNTSYTVTVLT